ncbi:hypothetical protein HJFPF1_04767 [Paramyrothecium foliicola]|nr:hypothetical protein HJFPF1_04767 [Paramyrothecium foliicola]
MKLSHVFLWQTSLGLAIAAMSYDTIAARGEPQRHRGPNTAYEHHGHGRFDHHGPKKHHNKEECDSSPKQGMGMTFWNEFSQPINDDVACVAFRSLEWLAYNLIQPTEEITSEAGTRVFVPKHEQGGPLVLNLRAIMLWTKILDDLKAQLEATNVWSLQAQLHVAQCYLDYAFQTAAWLSVLKKQSCDFNPSDPASCLVYDKIEALYITYANVANLIYGKNTGVPKKVEELITGNFPSKVPEWFKTRYPVPAAGTPIRDYIASYDFPLPEAGKLFEQNQETWACTDFRGGVRPWCGTQQEGQRQGQGQNEGQGQNQGQGQGQVEGGNGQGN